MRGSRAALLSCLVGFFLLLPSCESVNVEGPSGPGGGGTVTVSSVSVSPSTFTLTAGSTQQLSATVRGNDGSTITNKTVTWSSSSTTVATVSSSGLVSGVSSGSVTITATADGVTGSSSGSVGNPLPIITSLSPQGANYGQAAFELTVLGSGFISSSVVRVGGDDRTTRYVSTTELKADMPASDLTGSLELPVTVFNPSPGGGTSAATTFQVSSCLQGTLGNEVANPGTLTSGDCLLEGGEHFHTWGFQGVAGQLYQVAMESNTVDTYLSVFSPAADLIGEDDDGGESANSRLTFRAPSSGIHLIFATTVGQGETGGYTIRGSGLEELVFDVPISGQIPVASQGVGDAVAPVDRARVEGVPADRFGFPVTAEMGLLVEARHGSTATLDAAMEVFEVSSDPLGGNYDVDVVPTAAGGEIVAGIGVADRFGSVDVFGGSGTQGSYVVSVQECRVFPISFGGVVTGATSLLDDCAIGGAGIPGAGWTSALLTFTGTAGQYIALGASSSWDNFLLLLGPDGSLVAADDDSGGGTDALVAATLPDDGTYVAILLPYTSGDYGVFAAALAVGAGAPEPMAPPSTGEEKGGGADAILQRLPIRSIRGMTGSGPRVEKAPSRKSEGLWARLRALGLSFPGGGQH